jgi:hypothetical protein
LPGKYNAAAKVIEIILKKKTNNNNKPLTIQFPLFWRGVGVRSKPI